MKVFGNRASAVLYNYLKSNNFNKPFLLPSNVCPVVPLTFLKAGVNFDFVDIDESHAMNKSLCFEKLSTDKYQGLLFVHAYGKDFNNDVFYNDIKSFNRELCIIDDKCLCIPGTITDIQDNIDCQLFSTGYAKYVEMSFGGYANISVSDKGNYTHFKRIFDYETEIRQQTYIKECLHKGMRYEWSSDMPWLDLSDLNMNGDEYLSLIEKKKMEVIKHKDMINAIYRDSIPKHIRMGDEYENWRFCIFVNNQKQLLDKIFKHNLFAGTNFPSVSYMFNGIRSYNAELESSKIINLFNDFRISEEQALRISEIVNTYYE